MCRHAANNCHRRYVFCNNRPCSNHRAVSYGDTW